MLCQWSRTARGRAVACHDGRSRGELVWYVSAAAAVLFCDNFRQFLSLVGQVAVVNPQIVETKEHRERRSRTQREQNRQLSAHRDRNHLCDLHTGCYKVAPLYPAGVSYAGAPTCAALAPSNCDHKSWFLDSNGGDHLCLFVDCDCVNHPASHCTVFSRVSAFPAITRVFTGQHAIGVRRIRGTERGLVFSLTRAELSNTAQQKERSRFYVQAWPAVRDYANLTCRDAFSESSQRLEILFHTWL